MTAPVAPPAHPPRGLAGAVREYRAAFRAFQPAARAFLAATFMTWLAHGIASVLFNLYLVAAGYREAFVGRAVSLNALGMALTALPAGMLAERWGRRRCLIAGAVLEGAGMVARALAPEPGLVLAACFVVGVGQSVAAISAIPYIAEHSTPRERTHLFSTFFSVELMAGVFGSALGGWLPRLAQGVPALAGVIAGERATLVFGAALAAMAAVPLLLIRRYQEMPMAHAARDVPRGSHARLVPVAVNALMLGLGAGLVIPFMNLYFARRFACSPAQIGTFFSAAQVTTAIAALLGPLVARRYGRLRTATVSELLSLPFLLTLGLERHLGVAVGAFLVRATLMQASTPLLNAFLMESLPPALRARSTSLANTVWNAGWAVSALVAGVLIQRFGYAMPFFITGALYATAAMVLYLSFRSLPDHAGEIRLSEEQKGRRGEGPLTE